MEKISRAAAQRRNNRAKHRMHTISGTIAAIFFLLMAASAGDPLVMPITDHFYRTLFINAFVFCASAIVYIRTK